MLIPYSTDAPIYHLPFATVGLIVVNVLVFAQMFQGDVPPDDNQWILVFGDGLHPSQWVTSNFLHIGVMHLFGNMFFLWVFGIVVEGKIGWWKFLACYMGIGVVQAAVVQTVMLGYDGFHTGALGASAAIFGLVAMALVWAPKNDISCLFFFFPIVTTVQISIVVLGSIYFAWEFFVFFLWGFSISSAALHLMGGSLGFGLAIVMLKKNLVDCEGWDVITVWQDKPKPLPSDAPEELTIEHKLSRIASRTAPTRPTNRSAPC